ncbi:MAG: fused MFS/spermidine synthase [Polyangiaceae bacterium]
MTPNNTSDQRPVLAKRELFLTVFTTGAAVMVIEIMGTRIIGPVFGIGLFVWSALLTVTLGALAVGYYAGGVLADRFPHPWLMGSLVSASGFLLGIVRMLCHAVLSSTEALGPRWGAFGSAALLFAPCLVTLGMVGPVAVRHATTTLLLAGRSVGSIYAVSTAGSLLGTLTLVFLIIPVAETNSILTGTATLLTLLGAVSLASRGWPLAYLGLLVPALSFFAPEPSLPDGITILERSQSMYGLVEVINDSNRNVRFLRTDHSILGARYLADGSSAFAFLHLLEAVRFMRPNAKDMLQIGLGIGSLPQVLGAQGVRVDSVEIDPAVADFAKRYFGFTPTGDVIIEDARTYLRHTERRYDIIVHDTFTGGTTPEHLLSVEVLQRIHALLRPGGVLMLNFIGYQEGSQAEASFAVSRTIRSVFRNVRVFRDEALLERSEDPSNLLFFASDAGVEFNIPADAHFENEVCEQTQRSFQDWEVLKQVPSGPVITDARNPLARLQMPVAERHFAAMNRMLPSEVWLD